MLGLPDLGPLREMLALEPGLTGKVAIHRPADKQTALLDEPAQEDGNEGVSNQTMILAGYCEALNRCQEQGAHSMNTTTQTDYERDFYQWTQTQAALLRQGKLAEVDLENIAEEIESMGRSDRRAISSHLRNVLLHLLKWQYQPERRSTSWRSSIRNGRHEMVSLLKESPSLKPQVAAIASEEYPVARDNAADETGLPPATFPAACPFTVEQVTGDYWPA